MNNMPLTPARNKELRSQVLLFKDTLKECLTDLRRTEDPQEIESLNGLRGELEKEIKIADDKHLAFRAQVKSARDSASKSGNFAEFKRLSF